MLKKRGYCLKYSLNRHFFGWIWMGLNPGPLDCQPGTDPLSHRDKGRIGKKSAYLDSGLAKQNLTEFLCNSFTF